MFNAFKYSKKLEEVGFTHEEAEASVNVLWDIMEENLATKQDILEVKQGIKDVRTELKQDIANLRNEVSIGLSEVYHTIDKLESKLVIKLGGMLIVAMGMILTLQKILLNH